MSAANNEIDVAIDARIDNATTRVVIPAQESVFPLVRFDLRSESAPVAAGIPAGSRLSFWQAKGWTIF